MEYDRALYRVYERTIEELITSRRRLNIRDTNHVTDINTSTNTNPNADDNGDDNNTDDTINNSQQSPSSSRHRNTSVENQNLFDASNFDQLNQYDANFIPFILPMFLTPYTNAVSGVISTGNWRLLLRRNPNSTSSTTSFRQYTHNEDDDTVVTSPRGFFGTLRPWGFSRLTTNDDGPNSHNNNNSNDDDDGDGGGQLITTQFSTDVEMTDLNTINTTRSPGSPSGLRRRPNSISPREDYSSSSSNSSDRSRSSNGSGNNADEENMYNDRHLPTLVLQHSNDSITSGPNSPTSATVQLAQNIASTQLEQEEQQQRQDSTQNNTPSRDNDNDDNDRETTGCSQKGLLLIMSSAFLIATIHLAILAILHFTYIGPRVSKSVVGMTGSLTDSNARRVWGNALRNGNVHSTSNIHNNHAVRMTCLEQALSTHPIEKRSKFRENASNKTSPNEKDDDDDEGAPLLAADEILQIKIIYGKCNTSTKAQTKCSRVRYVDTAKEKSMNYSNIDATIFAAMEDYHSSSFYWKDPTYRFSTNEALLYLENDMLQFHNISLVNVTLTERCLNTGSDNDEHYSKRSLMQKIAQPLAQIYGMDPVVVNQFMYGIKSTSGKYRDGYVYKLPSKERWSYSKKMLDHHQESIDNIVFRFYSKIGTLLTSVIAYFFITSVTALIVRVLSSSGVMILFPFFSLFSAFGIRVDMRVLDYAHPWLGAARRQIRRRGLHPITHFVNAHLSRLLLLYAMYESCQAAWSAVFYNKSVPVDLPLWIFAVSLVVEYFSLIYVRSALR